MADSMAADSASRDMFTGELATQSATANTVVQTAGTNSREPTKQSQPVEDTSKIATLPNEDKSAVESPRDAPTEEQQPPEGSQMR